MSQFTTAVTRPESPPTARRLLLSALAVLAACGGGAGGGSRPPQLPVNDPPSMQLPPGLAGLAPSLQATLPTGDTRTYTLTATDPNDDPLQWQITAPAAAAQAAGVTFQSPVNGSTIRLQVAPVALPVAVPINIVVQDSRGGTAAVDILLVRSGAPLLRTVEPATVFAGQPQRMVLGGSGFSLGGTQQPFVAFNGAVGTDVVVVSDSELRCKTPLAATATGPGSVTMTNSFGTSGLIDAMVHLRYPPQFDAADLQLDGGGAASELQMVQDGAVHAVFLEAGVLKYRTGNGATFAWQSAVTLSGVAPPSAPCVFAQGDRVLVAWIGNGNSVWLRQSDDGGTSFAPEQRLDSPTTIQKSRVRIAADGDRCVAGWIEGNPLAGQARAFAATSVDGGANWSAAAAIDGAGNANQTAIDVACIGTRAHACWLDDRAGAGARGVFVSRSDDGGATWLPGLRLSAPTRPASALRLVRTADRARLVWVFDNGIWTNNTNEFGEWRNPEVPVRTGLGALSAPDIAAVGDEVYVVYLQDGNAVWLSRATDGGELFSGHVRLDADTGAGAEPRVAAVGGYVFAVWQDSSIAGRSPGLVRSVSTDAGVTWLAPAPFGDGSAAQEAPQLLVRGAQIILGWIDHRTVSGSGVFATINRP